MDISEEDLIYIHEDEVKRLIDVMLTQPDGGRLAALMFAGSFVDPVARADLLAYVDARLSKGAVSSE